MTSPPKRIAILASGTGTNAEKIIRYFKSRPNAEVVWVGSNKANAPVLQMASELGVPSGAFTREELNSPKGVLSTLKESEVDLIVLAGFLLLFPTHILEAYPGRVINIHPALLPKFGGKGMYGMNVHRAVKEAGEKESGITIHLVDEHYDEGAVIFQASVALGPEDSPEAIARKVQELEHLHFPLVIEDLLTQLPE